MGLFDRTLAIAERHLARLSGHVGTTPVPPGLVREAMGCLAVTLVELPAATGDIRLQNEALNGTRDTLEAERQRHQEVLEGPGEGGLITDQRGFIQEANRCAVCWLRTPQYYLIGKPLAAYVEAADRVALWTLLDRLKTTVLRQGCIVDGTARRSAETNLQTRLSQQAAVADLGQRALAGSDLQTLMQETAACVAQILGVEYCKVLELLPQGQGLRLRAGVGWQEGVVGHAVVAAGADSQAGYTLLSSTPVVVDDLRTETRFRGPLLLREHGVVSGLSVIIAGPDQPFGVLGAHTTRRRTFSQNDVNFLLVVANVLAQAIMRQRAEAELRQRKRQIEAFAHRLVEVQEAERRHLARELHDELGQNLTGLHLLLEVAARETGGPDKATLGEAQRLVTEVMGQVRHLARELRPAILDDLGLVPALQALFERYSARTQIRVAFEPKGPEPELTPAIRTATYRIVQEALTNAARHAGVSLVTVRLRASCETLTLEIIDQGVGFDPATASGAGTTNGLAGMRERARLAGGKLRVTSRPGAGTRITASLPLGGLSSEPPEP